MSLNLKHRPTLLKHIVGNRTTVKALLSKVKSKSPPHSFLITGPSGCGKTTIGRILAIKFGALGKKESIPLAMDYKELDSADFRGIDTIRDIRNTMQMSPMKGEAKMFLLDECHQLTAAAQEALLKALEDTPEHVFFVLCTTEPQKLKVTLKRRCAHFTVEPVEQEQLEGFLRGICEKENKKVPGDVFEEIAERASGSPGQALMFLEEVIDLKPKDMKGALERKEEEKAAAIELVRKLHRGANWRAVSEVLRDMKDQDAEGIRRLAMNWCCTVLTKKDDSRAYLIMSAFQEPFFNNGYNDLVVACYEVVKGG